MNSVNSYLHGRGTGNLIALNWGSGAWVLVPNLTLTSEMGKCCFMSQVLSSQMFSLHSHVTQWVCLLSVLGSNQEDVPSNKAVIERFKILTDIGYKGCWVFFKQSLLCYWRLYAVRIWYHSPSLLAICLWGFFALIVSYDPAVKTPSQTRSGPLGWVLAPDKEICFAL